MNENDWLARTRLLTGSENLEKLVNADVLVVGLGGVGAYAAEQLCRAGIGRMAIADGDAVKTTNRNRQLPALISTEGLSKASVMAKRLLDINPDLKLTVYNEYIRDQKLIEILDHPYNYVVDAIDMLSPKVYLIFHSLQHGLNIVSSMGAGGKYDPGQIQVTDISETYNCKFAFDIRKRLHKLGISAGVKVVFSPELVSKDAVMRTENEQNKKSTVGTMSYMPAVFGCFCASVVIRDIISSTVTAHGSAQHDIVKR
ncbi:MAG: tRNA threonylcarbamoyladenosine dehydratase [Bacteroidia bacterium]|nr:tRNA threonylcarbamoyladenosine dehydratase [Bacteroidia bacterium]